MSSAITNVLPTSNRPLTLLGLCSALNGHTDVVVIGQPTSVSDLVRLLSGQPEAVAAVDSRLFWGAECVEATRLVKTAQVAHRVVVVGPLGPQVWLRNLFACGPVSYVWDGETVNTLVTAVRSVAAGRTWRCPALKSPTGVSQTNTDHQECLSEREIEVLGLVAQGYTDMAVSQDLGITPRTVSFHLSAAKARLGATSRVEVVVMAAMLGYFDRD